MSAFPGSKGLLLIRSAPAAAQHSLKLTSDLMTLAALAILDVRLQLSLRR